jgi:hypothetical protein
MSVLSIFEATPNRVRSLARLALHLGPTNRETLRQHLMPAKDDAAQFSQLMRETVRLGLLEEPKGEVILGAGIEAADLRDDRRFLKCVEAALVGEIAESGENRAFRYALSWLLAQASGHAIPWNSDQHLLMRRQMEGDDCYDVTNVGRFAMLCYWARFLGFATRLDIGGGSSVIPDPSEALARRLTDVFPDTSRITLARFFDLVAKDCPVLEGGAIRREVEGRFREKRPSNQLSLATSLALWRLEERKVVRVDHLSDAETWVLASSITGGGAGSSRLATHIERLA